MEQVVIHTSERSTFVANSPTATEIENAFQLALYPVAGRARWIGPSVRIVRTSSPGSVVTHAAWLLEANTADDVAAVLRELNTQLQAFSADFATPGWQRFAPDFHGDRSWWADGHAARTRTRDNALAGLESHLPFMTENPVGPNHGKVFPVLVGVGVAALAGGAIALALRMSKPAKRRRSSTRQLPKRARIEVLSTRRLPAGRR
jgi:hypothetical protein